VLTVVPLTSSTARVYPFQVLLRAQDTGLQRDSKAQAEQVRAIDTSRLVERVSTVSNRDMAAVDRALRLHLQL
jgi:mRNA interferase MazF